MHCARAVRNLRTVGHAHDRAPFLDDLRGNDSVVLSVRPEDVELAEARPQGDNVWEARVDQKVFLGEFLDFQVKVLDRVLLARAHPSLRKPIGQIIHVRINPQKCIGIAENAAQLKAA